IAGDARANVLLLLSGQRLGLGIGKMRERNRRHVEVRLDEGGGLRDRDVRVDVDGGALRPDLASRLAVLARRGRRVLVPLLGHCWSVVLLVIANTEWRVASSKFKNALFAIRYSLLSKHTEMLRHNGVVELDLIGGAAKYDATGVDDDDVVGEGEGELDVLLDQHGRLAFGLELRDGAAHLGHQWRRGAL